MIAIGTNIETRPIRFVDFSNETAKATFIRQLQSLTGQYRVSITKRQHRRSLNQNAFLWAAVYPVVVQGFADQWGESITIWQAHEAMKATFLSRKIGDFTVPTHAKATSTTLSMAEFSEYIEKISKLCAEMFGLCVPTATSTF